MKLRLLAALALAVLTGCGVDGPEAANEDDTTSSGSGDQVAVVATGAGGGATVASGTGGGGTTTSSSASSGGSGGAGAGGSGGAGGGSNACPPGVICATSLPFIDMNTTEGADAVLDGYGCAPSIDESGPEKVYRIELTKPGLLAASLDNLGAGVDVDVHILQENNAGACVDRGHWDAAAYLPAGEYWVVVDSWVDDAGPALSGSYELTVAVTEADTHVADGLESALLDKALKAFDVAWFDNDTVELEYGIVDYTLPSTEPRFFVLDLRHGTLQFAEYASHGEGSQDPNDITMTGSMSNVNNSHASSVGMVKTAETYYGSNGYSLRLDGLEVGYNHNDRPRAIVIHGANYSEQAFIDQNGYLGRSWGCPAVGHSVNEDLIDAIKNGRLVLKYFNDSSWLANSAYMNP